LTRTTLAQLAFLVIATAFVAPAAFAAPSAPELDPGSLSSGLALASSVVLLLSHRGQK
jgi:hypothetical protein